MNWFTISDDAVFGHHGANLLYAASGPQMIQVMSQPRGSFLAIVTSACRKLPLAWVIFVILFSVHAWILGDWIIDDAGISFAYARNLAEGAGPVAQPGLAPVEGYSNPAWVLVLAGLSRLDLLDTMLMPKIVSMLLVFGAMFPLWKRAQGSMQPFALLLASLLLASQPAFVIWCMSGLENALSVAFACLAVLAATHVLETMSGPVPRRWLLMGSLCAAGLALCRPDGLLYVLALPLAILCVDPRRLHCLLPWHLVLFVPILLLYEVWRIRTFGDWLPNTYYAKGGDTSARALQAGAGMSILVLACWWVRGQSWSRTLSTRTAVLLLILLAALLWWPRFDRLLRSFGGPVLGLPLGALALLGMLRTRTLMDGFMRSLLSFAIVGLLVFSSLPQDWMGEYRFATAWFPVATLLLVRLLPEALAGLDSYRYRQILTWILLLGLLPGFMMRTEEFIQAPTVPMSSVRREWHEGSMRLNERLGGQISSFALPDVGAMLWWSPLRILDLAGLCDRELARAPDAATRTSILLARKPDLIAIHGFFAERYLLGADPTFAQQYIGLDTPTTVAGASTTIEGLFLRRDLVPKGVDPLRLGQAFHGSEH